MYCRNCGKEVHEKAIACPACGVPPLCEDKYCSKCGASTQKDTELCTQCGERIGIKPQAAFPAFWRKTIILLIVYLAIWITTVTLGGRSVLKLTTGVNNYNVNQTDYYYKIWSPCPFIVSAMRGSQNNNKASTASNFLWLGHPVKLNSPLSEKNRGLIASVVVGCIIAIRKIWVIS